MNSPTIKVTLWDKGNHANVEDVAVTSLANEDLLIKYSSAAYHEYEWADGDPEFEILGNEILRRMAK